MSEQAKRARREKFLCTLTSWGMAGVLTFVAFIALLRSDAWSVTQAVFAAGFIFLGLGVVFATLFCRTLPGPVIGPGIPAAPRPGAEPAPKPPEAAAKASSEPKPAPTPAPEPASAGPQAGVEAFQRIRGVGPKLAATLQDAGVRDLAQIAGWSEADVAWWDENIEGFRGRVSRDGWVQQARKLLEEDGAGGDAARQG